MTMLRASRIRRRIMVPLAVLLFLGIVGSGVAHLLHGTRAAEQDFLRRAEGGARLFDDDVEDLQLMLAMASQSLMSRRELGEAFADRDRDRLRALVAPLFASLRESFGFSRIRFMAPNGITVLILPEAESGGDRGEQTAVRPAEAQERAGVGIHVDADGRCMLRSTQPWREEGTLLGLLQLDLPLASALAEIELATNLKAGLRLVRPGGLQESSAQERCGGDDAAGAQTLPSISRLYGTAGSIPEPLARLASGSGGGNGPACRVVRGDQGSWRVFVSPLRTSPDEPMGDLLLFENNARQLAAIRTESATIGAILLLFGAAILALLYLFLGVVQRRLVSAIQESTEQIQSRRRELERFLRESRSAHEDLGNSYQLNRDILAAITSILISVDRDGAVILWNGAAERELGISRESGPLPRFDNLSLRWDWETVRSAIAEALAERRSTLREMVRFERQDGSSGFLQVRICPVLRESILAGEIHEFQADRAPGEGGGFVLVADDVTARLELERQLTQSQKLESIGHLAAGIAHEINTPTQFIGDNTRFLQDCFGQLEGVLVGLSALAANHGEGDGNTTARLEEILQAVRSIQLDFLCEEIPGALAESLEGLDRVAKIVRAMKEFSHPGSNTAEPADLNKSVRNTLTVARNEWKYVAEAETDLAEDLPQVPCVVNKINQVLLNLVVNAAQAIEEKLGPKSSEKGRIHLRTRRAGDSVELRVRDTGCGMSAAVREQIFDPFFTTKEVGKGSGQGLAMARSIIVDEHGGSIEVESEAGQGTTFIIRLPIAGAGGGGDGVGVAQASAAAALESEGGQ